MMQRLASVMGAAPLPVLATNEYGYYVYENEAARRFLGYEPSDIVGKQVTDLVAYDPRWTMATLEHLKRRGHLSGRARYRHADGSLRVADVNIFRQLLEDDTPVFVSLVHPLPEAGGVVREQAPSFDLGLSDVEMRLLQLFADGFADAQVARLLGEPEGMIGKQVRELLEKMSVSSRTEAVVLAFKKRAVL